VDAFLSYNVLAHALGTQRQALKEHADVERESSASRMSQKTLKDMIEWSSPHS
jgi:hypothetical protein